MEENRKRQLTPEQRTEELLKRYNLFVLSDKVFTKKVVAQIDVALNAIQEDPFYQIIPMFYFKAMSLESISLDLEIHIRTVKNKKRKLIRKMAAILFSDDVISAIYNE